MKFPNWFKISWWILLIILSVMILIKRYNAITTGQSVSADIFILFIFVALMLVPVFSEIEFFGIKLKKEIDELKKDISIRFGDIKNEIRSTQNQTLNATFHGFNPPPPDNKLPELEADINKILSNDLKRPANIMEQHVTSLLYVDESNIKIFSIRYNIERQLRRIWDNRFQSGIFKPGYRYPQSLSKIIQDLAESEVIDKNFQNILREIISICNYAIHGEEITDSQMKFVKKNAVLVLDYLSRLK